jgi:hypothetical protein
MGSLDLEKSLMDSSIICFRRVGLVAPLCEGLYGMLASS